MIKKLFIIAISLGMAGATLMAMQGPSSSASSSLSESSDNERERTVREKQVKRLKASHAPRGMIKLQLDPRVQMLIERAAAPQAEIDNFFLHITDQQIRVLNKIIFYQKLGQAAYLFATEQAIFNALPPFVKQLFEEQGSETATEK